MVNTFNKLEEYTSWISSRSVILIQNFLDKNLFILIYMVVFGGLVTKLQNLRFHSS